MNRDYNPNKYLHSNLKKIIFENSKTQFDQCVSVNINKSHKKISLKSWYSLDFI